MPFYRDHIYPQLVKTLGDPKPIREVRERIVPLAGFRIERMEAAYLAGFPKAWTHCWWGTAT